MLRNAIISLVCLGTLLPKGNATLSVLLPRSFQMMVICTGSEIAVIALDHTGKPVDQAEIQGLDCLAEATALTDPAFEPPWMRLARDHGRARGTGPQLIRPQHPEALPSRGRPPPVARPSHII